MLDLTRSILVWREPVTARSRTICSCTKTVSSLTLAVSSWVVFRSSSNLVTLPAKSIRALLPLRLSWVTPAPRIGQAIDASMLRTTSTFPAVDIGSLLPRSQREEGRRNRTCQAQDNARKNLSTARRLFWEPRAMNGYLSDRVQVTLLYRPFQSPANRSLRVPTVSLKRPTKQAPNADGFPSWEESVGFCERGMGSDRGHGGAWGRGHGVAWGPGGHGPGRPGWLPTQVPHRSGLAHHAHPVPHLMNSRPARSVVGTWTWFRSRCTCQVSLQRLMRRHPLPLTGSLGLVPPLQRYYEVLRLPAAHFAALRFLRLAIPSLRPLFVPPAPDAEPWINLELVGGISSRRARWKRQGLPSSRRNPCDHSPYSSDPGVTRQAEWTMS